MGGCQASRVALEADLEAIDAVQLADEDFRLVAAWRSFIRGGSDHWQQLVRNGVTSPPATFWYDQFSTRLEQIMASETKGEISARGAASVSTQLALILEYLLYPVLHDGQTLPPPGHRAI